jgi:hypothetical protein
LSDPINCRDQTGGQIQLAKSQVEVQLIQNGRGGEFVRGEAKNRFG